MQVAATIHPDAFRVRIPLLRRKGHAMRLQGWCVFALVLSAFAGSARADVPFAVNQQGLLVDTAGVPMNGSVDLFFRVWAHPTSTAPADLVYQELHLDRPVVDGVYEAILGTGSFPAPPFSPALFASPDRWLEIQVEAETLTPRQRILAVPYALQAQLCEFATRADEADQAQTLNGFDESDFQSVISGSCPAGQAIRAIAQNGTVTCELDDFNTGDITGVTAGTGLAGGATAGNATLSIATGGVTSALIADGTIANADVAAAAAIAPTKIAGTAATRTFTGIMDFNGTLFIDSANGGRVGIDDEDPEAFVPPGRRQRERARRGGHHASVQRRQHDAAGRAARRSPHGEPRRLELLHPLPAGVRVLQPLRGQPLLGHVHASGRAVMRGLRISAAGSPTPKQVPR